MKEEKELQQENKSGKIRLKMTFAIIILAALFIVELYLMMNFSKSYLLLGIIGLVMLCLVYLIIDFSFKIQNDRALVRGNEYESIYKAQKVSYVSMKQSFLDIERILDRIRENSEVPTEELIQAQKAVGKVTIKRNKENAAAIINSNEKLLESINSFENKMNDIISSMNQPDKESAPDFNPQEITETLAKVQENIRAEISAVSSNIEASVHAFKDEIIQEVEEKIASANEEMMQKVSEISVEPVIVEKPVLLTESSVSEETAPAEPAIQTAPVIPEKSEVPMEPEIAVEPVMQEEPEIAAEPVMQEEPEIAAESVMQEEPEITAEPVMQEEPETAAEPVMQEEPQMPAETMMQPEPVIREEPVIEKESVIPESGKQMTQDEISSLLNEIDSTAEEKAKTAEVNPESGKNMTPGEIADLLSEINEKQEPEPEIEEENQTSNLGHVMTPEEIAALLADM